MDNLPETKTDFGMKKRHAVNLNKRIMKKRMKRIIQNISGIHMLTFELIIIRSTSIKTHPLPLEKLFENLSFLIKLRF